MARKVMRIPDYEKGKFYYAKDGYLWEEDRKGMNEKRKRKGGKKKKKLFGIF